MAVACYVSRCLLTPFDRADLSTTHQKEKRKREREANKETLARKRKRSF